MSVNAQDRSGQEVSIGYHKSTTIMVDCEEAQHKQLYDEHFSGERDHLI